MTQTEPRPHVAAFFKRLLPWLAAIGSGILLRGGYAPFEDGEVAWLALVPLLIALRFAPQRRAFGLGFVSGLVFWGGSLTWLWKLTENGGPWPLVILGYSFLAAYCALYTAAFAALAAPLWRMRPTSGSSEATPPTPPPAAANVWHDLARAIAASALWVGLELVRSRFLTGFAWNHLGVSQIGNRSILQLASLGGVYAVSAAVMLFNVTVANIAVRIWQSSRRLIPARRHWDLMIVLALLVAAFYWGLGEMRRFERLAAGGPRMMVAAVQPNAPSIFERDTLGEVQVLQRLANHSQLVAVSRPDLLVWPETSLLGTVPLDIDAMNFAHQIAMLVKAPLLVGATEGIDPISEEGLPADIANASWLFAPDGSIAARYRKQHLVPFGEYIPLDRWFPRLKRLSPIGFSCVAGTGNALMPVAIRDSARVGDSGGGRVGTLPQPATDTADAAEATAAEEAAEATTDVLISPLICFEDTVSELSRRAVRDGAGLLVNQSNDAWFGGSSEGRQHHAQAILRAVENRTPLMRCANAGVSGMIDAVGRSSEPSDFFAVPVSPRGTDWPIAPYTRWGDWLLAWPCFAFLLWHAARLWHSARRTGRG